MDTTNPLMPKIPSDQDITNMSVGASENCAGKLISRISQIHKDSQPLLVELKKEKAIKKKLLRKKKDIEALIQASNEVQEGLRCHYKLVSEAIFKMRRAIGGAPNDGPAVWAAELARYRARYPSTSAGQAAGSSKIN